MVYFRDRYEHKSTIFSLFKITTKDLARLFAYNLGETRTKSSVEAKSLPLTTKFCTFVFCDSGHKITIKQKRVINE